MTTNDATRTALRAEQGMWDAFAEEERIKQEMAAMGKANDATPREADRAVPDPDADAVEAVAASLANHAAQEGMNWYYDKWGDEHFPRWDDLPDEDEYLGDTEWPNLGRNHFRKMARAALAAVPTVQAAAGDDLDADMTLAYLKGWQDGQDAAGDDLGLDDLLDSVHPKCYIDTMRLWEDGTSYVQLCGLVKFPYFAVGTGPTRREAIIDAVRKAKEQEGAEEA